ncbi:MAG: SprT-like domain-containing protein [Defluviitaleaceae bacterium]|nr:SprT-like domain-containing protein [Defluviitaleaceae bacterium]
MPTLAKTIFELGRIYKALNTIFYNGELETPLITIQSRGKNPALGWCTSRRIWRKRTEGDECYYEINISAEYLNRESTDIIETLLHEMAHLYASMMNIKDTSRAGKYHNKKYKEIAESHGLNVAEDEKYGWTITSLTDEARTLIANIKPNRQAFKVYRQGDLKQGKEKKPSSTRKYICPSCNISVRATKDVNIACMDCKVMMIKELSDGEYEETETYDASDIDDIADDYQLAA